MEHIDAMDDLKDTIRLQAYAQRDPINEYRLQGADMFDAMIADIRGRTVRMVLSVVPKVSEIERVQVAKPISEGFEGEGSKKPKRVTVAKKSQESVGRNDLCPCGSGKKYKKCCGAPNNQ
jgi:preprotein translocase subunit SecA